MTDLSQENVAMERNMFRWITDLIHYDYVYNQEGLSNQHRCFNRPFSRFSFALMLRTSLASQSLLATIILYGCTIKDTLLRNPRKEYHTRADRVGTWMYNIWVWNVAYHVQLLAFLQHLTHFENLRRFCNYCCCQESVKRSHLRHQIKFLNHHLIDTQHRHQMKSIQISPSVYV